MVGKTALATMMRSEEPSDPDMIHFGLIELLFFAYRDFVSEPDRALAQVGFGRAHHRVLHFVNRRPGLTIAELLDILEITKQSLNRVLKDLIDQGYVEQRAGAVDRRQRLLFVTDRGGALARDLAALQSRRIEAALAALPAGSEPLVRDFLTAMVDPANRDNVRRIVTRGGAGGT